MSGGGYPVYPDANGMNPGVNGGPCPSDIDAATLAFRLGHRVHHPGSTVAPSFRSTAAHPFSNPASAAAQFAGSFLPSLRFGLVIPLITELKIRLAHSSRISIVCATRQLG